MGQARETADTGHNPALERTVCGRNWAGTLNEYIPVARPEGQSDTQAVQCDTGRQ